MRNWTGKHLKDISRIFSKVQIKSGASRAVMNQCGLLSYGKRIMATWILILAEPG